MSKTIVELEASLDAVKKDVRTDSYPMSIGEISAMYERNEIILRPEYQRYFRWTHEQKARLIESILIGLPLPSFFVAQDKDGNWEVVDGMQRLSTILDFMRELKKEATGHEHYKKFDKLTDDLFYLKDFSKVSWDQLSRRIQLDFKRAKIQITILMRADNLDAKFELFQRLNSGGTSISGQELRNAILASEKPELLKWLEALSENIHFQGAIGLPDKDKATRYDMELVLRFVVFLSPLIKNINDFNSLDVYLTHSLRDIISDSDFDRDEYGMRFEKTFTLIHKAGGDNCLKYRNEPGTGKFSIAFFEAVALGLAQNLDKADESKLTEINNIIQDIGKDQKYKDATGSGKNVKTRVPILSLLGDTHFKKLS